MVRSGLYTPETPNPPLPIGLVEDFTFKHPYLPNQVTEQHLCTQTTSYPLSACLDQKTQVEHTFYATMYLQIIEQHEQLLAAGWAWGSDQLEASSDVAAGTKQAVPPIELHKVTKRPKVNEKDFLWVIWESITGPELSDEL